MVLSNQLVPGMTVSVGDKLYRVESSVKVTTPKGAPFVKARLRELDSEKVVEKSFKLGQTVKDVALAEKKLEFLYLEGKNYLFLDIGNLEQVLVPPQIIGVKANYLKEGVDIKAAFYGDTIFSIELPQFLELMISKIENASIVVNGTKMAVLETGAKIEVPSFIEVGDIIKVDTRSDEYVQRM
ncbi:MAG: elongation factor P [Parachlamydiaceae bacterium]|nr:elongation factor P [Parachlamydiaceae bacterium]